MLHFIILFLLSYVCLYLDLTKKLYFHMILLILVNYATNFIYASLLIEINNRK